jgi:hypothetical protein
MRKQVITKFIAVALCFALALSQSACGKDSINEAIGNFVNAVKAARQVTTVQNRYGGLSNDDYRKRLILFDKVYETTDRLSDEIIKLKEINDTNRVQVLDLIKSVNAAVAELVASGTLNVKNDKSKAEFAKWSLVASAGIASIQIAIAAAKKPINTEDLKIESVKQ